MGLIGPIRPIGRIGLVCLIGLIAVPASAEAGIKPPPSNLGLVGYWSMDDCRSTKATDFSGSGNTGSLTNFALSTSTSNWVTGNAAKRGCALNFDGSNDVVDITDVVSLRLTTAGTWSAWIKPSATARKALSKSTDGSTNGYELDLNGFTAGNVEVGIIKQSGSYIYRGTPYTPNVWTHVVGVYDASLSGNNRMKLYINGVSVTGTVSTLGTPDSIGDAGGNLRIGARPGVSPPFFNGSLDDVRIYNRALSPTEVTALYASGQTRINASTAQLQQGTSLASGLVGHWTFDGQYLNTTTSTDTSGSGNNGTLTGGPVPTQGRLGQALGFDGSNDVVVLPNSASLQPTTAITVSAWFNAGSPLGAQRSFVEKNPGYAIRVSTDSKIYAYLDTTSSAWSAMAASTAAITAGQWYHAVLTYTSGQGRLYIDGVQQGATVTSFTGDLEYGGNNPAIGAYTPTGAGYWLGKIDDVRVYNRALTAGEVQQLYSMGR